MKSIVKKFSILIIVFVCAFILCIGEIKTKEPSDEMRGVWISTVYNLDWPDSSKVNKQKKELDDYYKELNEYNMNTVFFQVRPMGDAIYPSKYSPWSQYLTGKAGVDPGYDPLEYAISAAKKNNLEFHAWFNPFRISNKPDFLLQDYFKLLDDNNPIKGKYEYFISFGNEVWLNPGIPEVRQYVISLIKEVIKNYDIDGIHLDDYFYPYPKKDCIYDDSKSYEKYGEKNQTIADWRRENVNSFVKELGQEIKKEDENLRYGISPFGIWKNSNKDEGSKTNGLSSYNELYVDSKLWVEEEWIDYIAPQIYWEMESSNSNYRVLVDWWSNVVKRKKVDLYIGQAAYKMYEEDPWDTSEIISQIKYNRKNPYVKGSIFFRADNFLSDEKDIGKEIYNEFYK